MTYSTCFRCYSQDGLSSCEFVALSRSAIYIKCEASSPQLVAKNPRWFFGCRNLDTGSQYTFCMQFVHDSQVLSDSDCFFLLVSSAFFSQVILVVGIRTAILVAVGLCACSIFTSVNSCRRPPVRLLIVFFRPGHVSCHSNLSFFALFSVHRRRQQSPRHHYLTYYSSGKHG